MTDIEIAREAKMLPIVEIAKKLGISEDELLLYGNDKAKINIKNKDSKGKLILVTAINPTPYGEGKTTVSIGLADALKKLNKKVVLALREPSMGPVFGMKGGATGGGFSQILPMDDINLFFTGDMSAIEAANNLLCAAIDNHIYFGNELDIAKVTFKRCVDVNDRTLRYTVVDGEDKSFTITAASEIMALLCLANDLDDLKRKLANIVIGYDSKGNMIYAYQLKVEGAMTVLLKDAMKPNLVQTLENTPALIHGGPFANIAHGCNSIVATKTALSLGDYVVTEAGFGSDLGAEKFFDIKCRLGNLKPDCVLIVVTIKALKYNASIDKDEIMDCNVDAVRRGLPNLKVHIENMLKFNSNVMVVLNKYETDYDDEVMAVQNYCQDFGVCFSVCTSYRDGSNGAIDVANKAIELLQNNNNFKYLYSDNLSIKDKINKIAFEIYRAKDVEYSDEALNRISNLEKKHLGYLPICVAKTQYSLSDDAKKVGADYEHVIHVMDIQLYSGAGFIVVYLGNIITMPGLSKKPNYLKIDYVDNKIVGLS